MFWLLTALLSLLAALFVLVPLWYRTTTSPDSSANLRQSTNIALFRERSEELEADLAAGHIDHQQRDDLLGELQRNLLTDVPPDPVALTTAVPSDPKRSRWQLAVPLVLLLLMPLLAYPLYRHWGYLEDVQVMELFQATVDNVGGPEEVQGRIVELGRFAQARPGMPWVYYFLGENFASLGMLEEAQLSYARAAQLLAPTAEKALALGRVATFMYVNSDFRITPQVQGVIDEARQINPNEISILQLLAADAEQRQDWPAAVSYWRLLIQARPDSEMAQDLRARVAEVQAEPVGEVDEVDERDGPVVAVNLRLAEGLALDSALRVFVAVRNAEQEGLPPLAAVATTVEELPATIRLDDRSAVGPFRLSSAERVYVSALVSFAGTATPVSGDYQVLSEPLAHRGEQVSIDLVIREQLP